MKPVRIFRHIANEGPGYLAHFLTKHAVPYELIRVDQGDAIPVGIEEVSAIVFMGGPMSVNDDLPWLTQELSLIRRATQSGLPLLGHCLGGQLISKALGGEVTVNPVKEIGWHPVQRVDNRVTCDWLASLPEQFGVFHWHGETFSIPQGATAILQGEHCANQGFVLGNTLALQCHIEMTAEMLAEWVEYGQREIAHTSSSVQGAEQMMDNLSAKISDLHKVADTLYTRWLQPILASDMR